MKNTIIKTASILSIAYVMIITACKKTVENPVTGTTTPTVPTTPATDATLKSASSAQFPVIGMAFTYSFAKMADVMAIVKREVNTITFGNELKEESVVDNNGVYNYSTADDFYNLATANGLQVTGHTLVWYSQQRAAYLNGLITSLSVPLAPAPNLLINLNGNFEAGSGNTFTNWTNLAGGSSAATYTAVAGNNSTRAMEVAVTTPGANAYDVQSIGASFPFTSGHTMNISVDIKSTNTSGKVRVVVQNASYQQNDITTTSTDWKTYTFSLIVAESNPIVRFNFPSSGTYTIDNLVVSDPSQATPGAAPTAAQKSVVIDSAMKKYIVNTIKHYSGKIKTWDVVNEPFTDNGRLRTEKTSPILPANANNQFLYAQYVGSNVYDQNNYVLKAFQYAKAADVSVTTFINDYNLEYSTAKVDSMKALVTFINSHGKLIDGVGTQMHITLGTSQAGIDYAFKTLASTGLKVRISELDVALNPSKTPNYIPDATVLANQAAMYKYVVQSYIKNVPVAQRYGITIWGVTDTDSWLNTATVPDYPLLFDKTYSKKPAYTGFMQGLQ